MQVRFDHLTVEMPGHLALDDVSGELASGSVTAVIGPSGAGKSTLLGVLAGLIKPDRGAVHFDGEEVTGHPPEARRLGVVFQELRLFDFLSARDNVGFGPKVAGIAPGERRRRVDEALALVRADRFADRPAKVLSGGERQRIAIARALATRPRGLLLDEPFGALDAELKRGLRDELGEVIRRLGLTVLLVTHDRDDAFALASRLIVLHDGRIAQAGDAAELYRAPASEYVATLLGEANLLPLDGRDGDQARAAGARFRVLGTGARAVIRPEALALVEPAQATFRGTLVEARFAGGRWRLVVALRGAAPLIALVDAPPSSAEVALLLRGPTPTV
ncbi:MAG TPA: ABC transporter ATP-binding protein [Polyangia bacterium]|jgi:ABC-type sulfate/molybdate transport systems ATPase subunit